MKKLPIDSPNRIRMAVCKLLQKEDVDMFTFDFTRTMGEETSMNDLFQVVEELKKVVEELDILKKERDEKEIRKQARAKRKRLPKRDPITLKIYEQLITSIPGSDYKSARLRLAILILTICGIRVSELLPLKVGQLFTLVKSNWISINRSKRGPSSHKAYLTGLGKKLMDKRRQDFEIIFTMKQLDHYVFTSEKTHYKPLRIDTLTKEINLILRNLSKILPDKPNLTTHSFRIGFISQLWRDTNDIEFVRQAIGHEKVESTSSYIENLSDEERRLRMEQITSPEKLIIEKSKEY